MMKRLSVLLALGVALALASTACGKKAEPAAAKDPMTGLIGHTDAMIKLIEENKADPAKALQALTAYQEAHKVEIEQLKQGASELMQKDPMKMAAASATYGMKSAQLDGMAAELAAKAKPQ